MFESILRNEFTKLTGQYLSDEEYATLLDYLEYYDDGKMTTEDLHNNISNFVQDCFEKTTEYDGEVSVPAYKLVDWRLFPMAKKEFPDPYTTIITYRGGKVIEYKHHA